MLPEDLVRSLFGNFPGTRFTFSSEEDIFPAVIEEHHVQLYAAADIDSESMQLLGAGLYPMVFTRYAGLFLDTPCQEVPALLEKSRPLVKPQTVLVGFLTKQQHVFISRMFRFLFLGRDSHTRRIDNRMVEQVYDLRDAEVWMQLDLCHKPITKTRPLQLATRRSRTTSAN